MSAPLGRPLSALVTGGARGIGLGISRALADAGYDLLVCGVREEAAVDSIQELRATGRRVRYIQADVATRAGRERLISTLQLDGTPPNLLVNNAGVAPSERRDILEATEESYERVMSVNLKGPYFLTQAVARMMVAARRSIPQTEASIIFVTSVSATVASVNRGEYCLSKAGLSMAARLWAVRLAEFGIPVYEVRPGVVLTDMTAGVRDKYEHMMANGLLLQPRWGTPEDVGRAVVALTRGEFPYSTGQVIMVDGGLTVGRM